MDNGFMDITDAIFAWAEERDIALKYIQPGKPQQTA